MEEEEPNCLITQRILDLTLEIICLLTGEDCAVTRKSGEPLTPIFDSPSHSLIAEGKDKKILEATNQIIALLTEEGWKYLNGQKKVKKEAKAEDQPPLISPDGSRKRKRNPPEKCPRPIYAENPLQEAPRMLPSSQDLSDSRAEVKEEDKDEEASRESRQSVLKFGMRVIIKEEDHAEETNADGSKKRKNPPPPEKGPSLPQSLDSSTEEPRFQEDLLTKYNSDYREPEKLCSSSDIDPSEEEDDPRDPDPADSKGTQTNVKVKEEPVDSYLWSEEQRERSGGASEIGWDGQYSTGSGDKKTDPPGDNPLTRVPHVRDLLTDATADEDLLSFFSPITQQRERLRFPVEGEVFSRHIGPTAERPFECTVCGKCFAEKAHLGSHERAHTNERPYSCSVCGRCFGDKSHLAAHEITHATEKPYSCSICGKSYAEKSHLVSHERTHSTEKPHQCPVCLRCFAERSHLVNHERSHSSERRYACGICGKTFSEKGHLANHEKSHATERSFFCFECGKYFSQRGHYNRHQRTHTEAKPFSCAECGKSFSQKEYLIKHQRFHTGEKPYACLECGKCFTDRYDLAKHERIHTGDRPYCCEWCGKGFAQKSNLVRHERVHTNPPFVAISIPTDGDVPESSAVAQQ